MSADIYVIFFSFTFKRITQLSSKQDRKNCKNGTDPYQLDLFSFTFAFFIPS
jgi:hypothetical protein